MESLFVEHARPAPTDPTPLRRRVTRWMSTTDERLRGRPGDGDRAAVAAALREGLELAAEALRAEEEARRDVVVHTEVALAGFRRMLDALPIALLVTDLDGRVREATADRAASPKSAEPPPREDLRADVGDLL